jgi:sterol 3beta-glucosyltransferase
VPYIDSCHDCHDLTVYLGINATIRPAAGVLGVVAYPIHGAMKSGQRTWARKELWSQRSTRVADGIEEVQRSSTEERRRIVAKFKVMTTSEILKQRRAYLTDAAKAAMEESNFQAVEGSTGSTSAITSLPKTPFSNVPDAFENLDDVAQPLDGGDSEDEIFQRELKQAKELSLAEQRGYERGMAERFKDV